MLTSDYISLGAILVSITSIIVSIFLYSNQKKYIKTQDELNKLQLKKEIKELEIAEDGFISANMVRMGNKVNRIRVFNKGNGRANNVNINYLEKHNWIIMNDIFTS